MEKCSSGWLAQRKSWTRWLFNLIIHEMSCYHGFSKLPYSSEVPGVWHFLNALEYNYMDKNQKKKLCPNDISLGFGVPSKVGGWDMNEPTSEWRTGYGPKIFLWTYYQI